MYETEAEMGNNSSEIFPDDDVPIGAVLFIATVEFVFDVASYGAIVSRTFLQGCYGGSLGIVSHLPWHLIIKNDDRWVLFLSNHWN